MKKNYILLMFTILLSSSAVFAQNTKKNDTLTIGVDLMSRYIFRGTDVGGATPSMQPNLEYSTGKFAIGLWGAYSTNPTGTQETDIYLTYSLTDKLDFTLTDYFFPTDDGNYNYFNYKEATTGHLLEATVSYSGTKKFPLSFLLAANFYGADAIRLNSDGTRKGIQYSSYAEFKYAFNKFKAFMGFNLTNPDEKLGEAGFYGNGFGVVNLGITAEKKIKITKSFDLPMTFSLITNPQAEKIYFVFGFSL